jgi:hypothetical protein
MMRRRHHGPIAAQGRPWQVDRRSDNAGPDIGADSAGRQRLAMGQQSGWLPDSSEDS